jgi:predicted CopG family antitoxin
VNGERLIWLAPNVVNRLRAMRGPDESYSEVIVRLVETTAFDDERVV